MALKSVLKPDSSVTIGLAEAAAVYVIYQAALPSHADIRSAMPHDRDVEASRKRAAWHAAAVLGFVFLLTQDVNSFLIGGAALGLIDLQVKHANAVHPSTGKMAGPDPMTGDVRDFALPDYADTGQAQAQG